MEATAQEKLAAALDDLGRAISNTLKPIFLPILGWIDRQLRRWPRLYARLSR